MALKCGVSRTSRWPRGSRCRPLHGGLTRCGKKRSPPRPFSGLPALSSVTLSGKETAAFAGSSQCCIPEPLGHSYWGVSATLPSRHACARTHTHTHTHTHTDTPSYQDIPVTLPSRYAHTHIHTQIHTVTGASQSPPLGMRVHRYTQAQVYTVTGVSQPPCPLGTHTHLLAHLLLDLLQL